MFEPYEKNAGIIRYRLWPGEPVDEFTLKMLQQNAPRGVLLLGREINEEGDFLLLPVAGLVPITSKDLYFNNASISINNFITVANEVRASLREYMIPEEQLVLRPEWTWWNPETEEPVFLVLPTPNAKDISLSIEAYEALLMAFQTKRDDEMSSEEADLKKKNKSSDSRSANESANKSAKRKRPAKPWREVLREFWNSLD